MPRHDRRGSLARRGCLCARASLARGLDRVTLGPAGKETAVIDRAAFAADGRPAGRPAGGSIGKCGEERSSVAGREPAGDG